MSCRIAAASSGGKASSSRNAVTNCAHTKNGNRKKVRPFARSWIVVVMKLTRAEQRRGDQEDHAEEPRRLSWIDDGERRVGRPAGLRGAARQEEARQHDDAAEEEELVARHVDPRERHVRRADLERQHEVAEAADGERHDAEEDHDGAVHRAELVVEVGQS